MFGNLLLPETITSGKKFFGSGPNQAGNELSIQALTPVQEKVARNLMV